MSVAAPSTPRAHPTLLQGFLVQCRVIGALMMREIHTRYGRENIGYLWLLAEPLMLGTVISVLHAGGARHEGDVHPAAFAMVGYTIFIMFRGTVNRSEGAIHANAPLLYHRMVTVLDITLSRAMLELAGTVMAFIVLFAGCYAIGYVELPARPLYLIAGIAYVFALSLGVSMIIIGTTYNNRLLERFVHPFTYFQIPFSAAFFEIKGVPEPWRGWLLYSPLPRSFELVRYGAFEHASPDFIGIGYLSGCCLVLIFLGLVAIRSVKRRIHLM